MMKKLILVLALIPALAFAGNPGSPTFGSILSTASASVAQTFTSTSVLGSWVDNITAASATSPELAGVFRMTSNTGSTNPLAAYKVALGYESICGSGSAACWGFSGAMTDNGMASSVDKTSAEFDFNEDYAACAGGDPSVLGVQCGNVVVTGASTYNVNYGILVAGGGKILNGIMFEGGGVGPVSNDISTFDNATNVITDSGSHGNFIYAGNSTDSGNFIVGPGSKFIVAGNGNVTAPALTSTGTVLAQTTMDSDGLLTAKAGINVSAGAVNVYGTANGVALSGAASGAAPTVAAFGSDTNIGINLQPKGTGAVTVNGAPLATPYLSATSGSIGGGALAVGACTSATVTVSGATTSMAVIATPATYPGGGFDWGRDYVSAANTVTVQVCADVAGTPTASVYNVRVIP